MPFSPSSVLPMIIVDGVAVDESILVLMILVTGELLMRGELLLLLMIPSLMEGFTLMFSFGLDGDDGDDNIGWFDGAAFSLSSSDVHLFFITFFFFFFISGDATSLCSLIAERDVDGSWLTVRSLNGVDNKKSSSLLS